MGAYDKPVPPNFMERHWNDLDNLVVEKQKQFIRTVNERLEYGKHVRELHWTVLDVSVHTWGWEERAPSDAGDEAECEERPVYAPEDGKAY
jgi:hypothetical protein